MLYGVITRAPVEGAAPATIVEGKPVAGVQVVQLPYGVGFVGETLEAALKARSDTKVTWTKGAADDFNSENAFDRYASEARDLTTSAHVSDQGGDVLEAMTMKRASNVMEAEYRTDFCYHAQMEPLNSVATVNKEGDGAEIWAGTQTPTYAVKAAARALGTTPDKISLHRSMTGGAFGRRGHSDQEYVVDAVLLSKAAKRPVKVVWTREDDVHNGRFRPTTAQYIRAGIDANGNIIA